MRPRLLALMGALALALGGLVASAGPAAADQSHCYVSQHPDLYDHGGIHFLSGTNIRRGPYTDCDVLGSGYPNDGIDVHCAVFNSNNYLWIYLEDTTTGVRGWSREDALSWNVPPDNVPYCFWPPYV
jgi:hypothetical protein